jgi:hypothetical protein
MSLSFSKISVLFVAISLNGSDRQTGSQLLKLNKSIKYKAKVAGHETPLKVKRI